MDEEKQVADVVLMFGHILQAVVLTHRVSDLQEVLAKFAQQQRLILQIEADLNRDPPA